MAQDRDRDRIAATAALAQLWTVRLEFCVSNLEEVPHPPVSTMIGMPREATVDVKLNASHNLELAFGGALAEECTCRLVHMAKRAENNVSEFRHLDGRLHLYYYGCITNYASALETEIDEDLGLGNRQYNQRTCTQCGKVAATNKLRQAYHEPIPGHPSAS